MLWFSFEAEALTLPPEWVAHPKDLIPLTEPNSAQREKERTLKLRKLEKELNALTTEHRLALKKQDFVRVKELQPIIEAAQKKIDDFRKASPSPKNKLAAKRSSFAK